MISQVDIKHDGNICIMYQSGQKRVYYPPHKLPKTISHFIVIAIANTIINFVILCDFLEVADNNGINISDSFCAKEIDFPL